MRTVYTSDTHSYEEFADAYYPVLLYFNANPPPWPVFDARITQSLPRLRLLIETPLMTMCPPW